MEFSPSTWEELVVLREYLEAHFAVEGNIVRVKKEEAFDSSCEGSAEGRSKSELAVASFVKSLDGKKIVEAKAKVEEVAMRPFGIVGRLALCSSLSDLQHSSSVLMAVVHVAALTESLSFGVPLSCIGGGEEDLQAGSWDESSNWPELFPPNWSSGNPPTFSFRYKTQSKEEGSCAMFLVKGVIMGSNKLLLSALRIGREDEDPLSFGLNVSDFVSSSAFDQTGMNLSGAVTRASALQLSGVIREKLITPLLKDFRPYATSHSQSGSSSLRDERGGRGRGASVDPRFSGRGYGVPPVGLMPGGIGVGPAAGFGDPDLYPSFGGGMGGGGGMLFGPGNPRFDGGFAGRPGAGVPGVPPGARFDPYGPPGVAPPGAPFRPGPSGGRGGSGSGSGFGFPDGDPSPDHLRPPRDDDMFF